MHTVTHYLARVLYRVLRFAAAPRLRLAGAGIWTGCLPPPPDWTISIFPRPVPAGTAVSPAARSSEPTEAGVDSAHASSVPTGTTVNLAVCAFRDEELPLKVPPLLHNDVHARKNRPQSVVDAFFQKVEFFLPDIQSRFTDIFWREYVTAAQLVGHFEAQEFLLITR